MKIIQAKTGKLVEISLHPIAQNILKNRREKIQSTVSIKGSIKKPTKTRVFNLPTRNGRIRRTISRSCRQRNGVINNRTTIRKRGNFSGLYLII
jgi:hypothetical protein